MNQKKLSKLRREVKAFRQKGGVKSRELESLARAFSRELHSRGSEPNWVSTVFHDLRPISIPHHGGKDLNKFTARAILDQLENDIERFERQITDAYESDGDGDV